MSWSSSALVAETYDVLRPLGHSYGDVEFYSGLLRDVTGPVLEIACGTGRILARLAKQGIDVDGLDHCVDMLDVCRSNCARVGVEPRLYHADMCSFEPERRYAAVIVPAGSLRGAGDVERTREALRSYARALEPSGLLAIDLEPHVPGGVPGRLKVARRGNRLWTLQVVSIEYDPVHQRSVELLRYERWRDGELEVCELHQFALQHWAIEPFTRLLRECGFAEPEVHANYRLGQAPAAGDQDWTFITHLSGAAR
ncbi:class I SAM-dependent DNA methyltransferase [Streptomyces sp. NPDC001142]